MNVFHQGFGLLPSIPGGHVVDRRSVHLVNYREPYCSLVVGHDISVTCRLRLRPSTITINETVCFELVLDCPLADVQVTPAVFPPELHCATSLWLGDGGGWLLWTPRPPRSVLSLLRPSCGRSRSRPPTVGRLCCLMSSDVGWHIRDKLRPMPKHGSVLLYVHGNQKAR